LGFAPLRVIHHLLDAVEVIHELRDGADGTVFIDGEVGFVQVRLRPFEMGTGRIAETLGKQTGAHGNLGRAQLSEQRLSSRLAGLNFSGAHADLAGVGCGLAD